MIPWPQSLSIRLISASILGVIVALLICLPTACALPDDRAYELVTPLDMNGASPGSAVSAVSGNAVDFQAGPFGDAVTSGQTFYQAQRTTNGWQTRALTPRAIVPTKTLGQTAAALFFTPELSQTIFATEQPFALGAQDNGALNLYEESQKAR